MQNRENFGSNTVAIMALAGSAIGLGNIWRFPYMVGEHGGAAFIVIYLLASLLLSLPIMMSETVIGRRSQIPLVRCAAWLRAASGTTSAC